MTDSQEYDLQCLSMPSVTIYSDGSFKPDLHTGGYGSIMTCNGYSQFFYGGYVQCSNNAMELLAVLVAIRALMVPCRITIISDSKYVVDGLNSYLRSWVANGWKKSNGGMIANEALWREMWYYCQHHVISATWVKGHATNFSNSICDNLASIGAYAVSGACIPDHLLNRV